MTPLLKNTLPRYAAFAATVIGAAAGSHALWSALDPHEQEAVLEMARRHSVLLVTAAFLFPAALLLAVGWIFRRYIEPLRTLVDEVKLVTLANPSYRLKAGGNEKIEELTRAINHTLERMQSLQETVAHEVQEAKRLVEEEKGVLAALINEFPHGVVVSNADGQILLVNKIARTTLSRGGEREGKAGHTLEAPLLGRSIFGFIDRNLVSHALDVLEGKLARGEDPLSSSFVMAGAQQRLFHFECVPVLNKQRAMHGTVFVIQEFTQPAAGEEPDRGSISTSLKRVLDEVSGSDLARLVAKRCEQTLDVHMSPGGSADQAWVRIESFAVVQAVQSFVQEIKRATGVVDYSCRIAENDRKAQCDIVWSGRSIPHAMIQEWEGKKAFVESGGIVHSVGGVLERNNVSVRSGVEAEGVRAFLRFEFPVVRGDELRRQGRTGTAVPSRPEFYDFNLFARAAQHADTPLADLTYTAFDTETTGLRPTEGDEIISVGAVRIVGGKVKRDDSFDQLVDPRRPVPEASTRVHGIDDEMLRGQPPITEVLPSFRRYSSGTVLIGHNVSFDLRFFQLKEEACNVRISNPVLDTLLLSSVLHPQLGGHSIEEIAARLGVDIVGRHTALGDAIVTGEVFVRFLPLLADCGIRTLRDALEASRRSYLARVKY